MATIIKSSTSVQGTTEVQNMNNEVDNYWQTETERVYPTSLWKIKHLLNSSDSGEIALKVTNIDDEDFVDAEWIVFGDGLEELLQDPVRQGEYYFVMSEADFSQVESGIDLILNPLSKVIIVTRLGKITPNGQDYTIFIVSAKYNLLNDGGAGGGGAVSGAKVPSN
ncbi:MAG: hypothetical protein AAFO82_02560 [Bacteroidota bacterium]